ncbi:MAG: FAD-binding oxidoreductase [Bryobacteraceae bacterium]
MTGALASATREWVDILGSEHVISQPNLLKQAETATFATSHRIQIILRPANREQVQECLRVANRHRAPVYPISTGKNWGYGSRVPTEDGCSLLDLGRMNRIVDFSEELAYVTVEPGVTQRQLFEFLRQRGSGLWMDATGASPDCSLIGNTMERGFGHTPYGDHFAHVCGMEVILPEGDSIETGFGRFGTSTTPLYRWGLGPSLDGLFSQSNLGVVTRMTIWLMPAPEYFQAFFFRCDDERGLPAIIDGMRDLRLSGTLRSASHIGNDYKVLSGIRQYPWAETGGRTPLRPEWMARFRKELNFGAWNGSGGIYGTKAQVAEARRLVRKTLRAKVAKIQFLDDRMLGLAERFAGVYRLVTGWDLSRTLELAKPVYELMKGVPTEKPTASAYWRKPSPPPSDMDPDRDGCGLLWAAPVTPLAGDHAARLSGLACDILLAHGFEPMLSLTTVTDRTLTCVVSISYDRHVPGEDGRAMACYRELQAKLIDHGYHSYRSGVQSRVEMTGTGTYNRLLETLKDTLDPRGILSPGRYQSEAAATTESAQVHC